MNCRVLASAFLLSTVAFLGGCKKDPCKNVTCLNGGSCMDGSCICPAGFEDFNCGVDSRVKFIGLYSAIETCSEGNDIFDLQITAVLSSPGSVILNNFYGIGMPVHATVTGNTLTIPSQQANGQGTTIFTISGSGQMAVNVLTLTYTLTVGSESNWCTAHCTKY
jgi:hypothetical protein